MLLSPGFPLTSEALWTGSLVLGLLFLVFLTYRLWKCCWARQLLGSSAPPGPN